MKVLKLTALQCVELLGVLKPRIADFETDEQMSHIRSAKATIKDVMGEFGRKLEDLEMKMAETNDKIRRIRSKRDTATKEELNTMNDLVFMAEAFAAQRDQLIQDEKDRECKIVFGGVDSDSIWFSLVKIFEKIAKQKWDAAGAPFEKYLEMKEALDACSADKHMVAEEPKKAK